VITVARAESELGCWFSPSPPVCSVLWLLGPPADLVPALAELSAGLDPVQWRAAACVARTRPLPFEEASGCRQLLLADLGFTGTAVEEASSPLIRKTLSAGSACQVVSAGPSGGAGIWAVLAAGRGLQVCAGLFPANATVPDEWAYAATRMAMIAGTPALNRGQALGVQDALLHSFLAATLQAGGIAAIKGGLEMCGPGIGLTGSAAAIDRAEECLPNTRRADEVQVRHSLRLAGPWASPAHPVYRSSPESGRWLPAE
jgi:hypothetical protein